MLWFLYDKDLVESMLLEVVRRRETAYHVQDLICKKWKGKRR